MDQFLDIMPSSTSVSFSDEIEDPDGNLREVEIEADCESGSSANMNYGGLPDPPTPPSAVIEEAYYNDTYKDVEEEVYEENCESWMDRALEEAEEQASRRASGPEFDPVEHGGRY